MSELGLATEKTMHPDKKVEPDAKSLVNIWRSIPFEEEFARQVDSFCNQIRISLFSKEDKSVSSESAVCL